MGASLALQRGDLAGAAGALRRLAALDPSDRRIAGQFAAVLAQQGHWAEAYPVLKKGAPWRESARLQTLYAEAALAQRAFAEVEAALGECRPDDLDAILCQARLRYAEGRIADALSALERAADLSNDEPRVVMDMGNLALHLKDMTALRAIAERARRGLRREPENLVLAKTLVAILVTLRAVREAENFYHQWCEASADPVMSKNSPIDRLVAFGQYDLAAAAVKERAAPFTREIRKFWPKATGFHDPITRVVIHSGHELMRAADPEELAELCGLPVALTDLYHAPPEHYGRTGEMILFTGGVESRQWQRLLEIKQAAPHCPVVAWLQDNHHCYLWNKLIVAATDLTFPAQVTPCDYLASDDAQARVGPVIPTAIGQWSRRELARLYRDATGEARTDRLSGRFGFHDVAHQRNELIENLRDAWPEADIDIVDVIAFAERSPHDRFQSWRRHKTSLALPVARDVSTRIFDALGTGQIPIVPRDVVGLDRVIPSDDQASLPIIRLEEYSVAAIRAAHHQAIAAFDHGGEDAAERRHRYVLDRHMMAHRIADIVVEAARLLGVRLHA